MFDGVQYCYDYTIVFLSVLHQSAKWQINLESASTVYDICCVGIRMHYFHKVCFRQLINKLLGDVQGCSVCTCRVHYFHTLLLAILLIPIPNILTLS